MIFNSDCLGSRNRCFCRCHQCLLTPPVSRAPRLPVSNPCPTLFPFLLSSCIHVHTRRRRTFCRCMLGVTMPLAQRLPTHHLCPALFSHPLPSCKHVDTRRHRERPLNGRVNVRHHRKAFTRGEQPIVNDIAIGTLHCVVPNPRPFVVRSPFFLPFYFGIDVFIIEAVSARQLHMMLTERFLRNQTHVIIVPRSITLPLARIQIWF